MAIVYPFRALRPRAAEAARIAAPPYDVVSTEEARVLAAGNPLSFLRVSHAEIELPPGTDSFSTAVYDRAATNFTRLRGAAFILETEPSTYLYRLRTDGHEQTGLAACFSLDEYDRDVIKKHERTRRDKEDDRTRHMMALGAQTGPVFLTYRASDEIDALEDRMTSGAPVYDFDAADGVRHTIWRARPEETTALVAAFARIPSAYIADGHHRAASAARARDETRQKSAPHPLPRDVADCTTVLAVAFPHDQVRILPYNRVVRDLARLDDQGFLQRVSERFEVRPGSSTPSRRGEIGMYFRGSWSMLTPRVRPVADVVAALDVSVLQDALLAPILEIEDVRTSTRIDFVGGSRGPSELERLVDSGQASVAFSMFPVSVADLMAVSDAGAILPPKSTWFEPKLRDGLLIHLI
jgi:uncharacterized protein (DUF1015 family)